MNHKEAEKLVDKCMKIILSCENIGQLNVAQKFSRRVYLAIPRDMAMADKLKFISSIETSIGYALCSVNRESGIKSNIKEDVQRCLAN